MPAGFNDKISSIRVLHGARVRLFNNDNFNGVNLRIDYDVDILIRIRLPQDPSKT